MPNKYSNIKNGHSNCNRQKKEKRNFLWNNEIEKKNEIFCLHFSRGKVNSKISKTFSKFNIFSITKPDEKLSKEES